MLDFGSLLTVVVLQVAAAVMVLTWLRARTPLSFSWALGWLLVLCWQGLHLSAPWGGLPAAICADCALQLAALLFLDSLDRAYLSARIGIPVAWICALPLALFTAGTHFLPASVPAKPFFLATMGATSLGAGIWALRNKNVRRWLSLPVIAAVTALAARAIVLHHAERAPNLALAVLLAMTAVAFARQYPRGSAGAIFAVSGFFGNTLMLMLTLLPDASAMLLRTLGHASTSLWIISAFGMMIVQIEEEARSVRSLQKRERKIREELERYAAVQVAFQMDAADEKIFEPACEAIAGHSPFREVAVLRRNARGEAEVICHSELHTANVTGIEGLVERYSTGDEGLRLSFQGARSVILRTQDHHRKRNHKLPGRSLVITLPGQSGRPQGWLWLATPAKAWDSVSADDLLPLESLASRLAVTMQNRELTRMLIRTDKLAGLGKLAGGVAHELNNPLTVVSGYAEMIHESTLEPSTRKQTAKILAESLRMKKIIEDLNRFSQPPTAEYGTHNMVDVLREVGQSLQTDLMRRGVSFEIHANGVSPVVYGCRESLSQIFFQLIVNAAEAIQRGGHRQDGRIRVDVESRAGEVHVLVADNGPGFDEEDRIFDPFYTTKEPGEGPGLGLSVSYALVQEHQGDITASNLQSGGAVVNVTLPLAPAEVVEMPAAKRIPGLQIASLPMAMPQPA